MDTPLLTQEYVQNMLQEIDYDNVRHDQLLHKVSLLWVYHSWIGFLFCIDILQLHSQFGQNLERYNLQIEFLRLQFIPHLPLI